MKRAVIAAVVAVLPLCMLSAYDFMERPDAVVLSPQPEGLAIAEGGYAQSAYRANVFLDSDIDRFQVEGYAHHGIFDIGRFRTSIFYGTYMLNGPVTEGTSPGADAAQWIMNAIHYEYGFIFAGHTNIHIGPSRLVILGEYSRRSYHPLRDGLEEPAADIIRGGLAFTDWTSSTLPQLTVDGMIRLGWSELYDFWGSSIPDPRSLITLNIALEAQYTTAMEGIVAFGIAMPDVILLRDGGIALDVATQAGVRIGRGAAVIEAYLDFYSSEDTEQIPDRPSPATLFGYGIRFVLRTG
ncbi:MAG: hypothetical protein MI724_18245 [Spirochaetales bacterium]|nr:hypothetical protein [Spirochaetales bacterium]